MRIKQLLFLFAVLLTGYKSNSQTKSPGTTAEAKKPAKTVKIGPQEYQLPPPVDSALIRSKLAELAEIARAANAKAIIDAIDEGYKKKETGDASLKARQNILVLQSLLAETQTSGEPNESMVATLAQALESYKKSGDFKSQSLVMNTYAVYYARKGEMDKAIPYFQDALRLKELTKDKAEISKITINLAAIFKALERYDESIAYDEYTIKANAGLKSRTPIAEAYLDIAIMKGLQQQYAQSEQLILKKALPLFQSLENKDGRMRCFESLADMYKLQKRYSEAKWFYLQAIEMANIIHNQKAHVSCLISLAEVKNAINDHDLALSDYTEAESIALQNNYTDQLASIKGEVGETYWKMGNYVAAENNLKEYNRLKDILLGNLELK